jgi:hypothetical protein
MISKFNLILLLDEKYKADYLTGKIKKKTYLACRILLSLEAKKIMLSSESKEKVIFFIENGQIDYTSPLQQLKELFINLD